MANKKNGTVSAGMVDKYIKEMSRSATARIQFGAGEEMELTIKKWIDPETFAAMVNRAVDSVFMDGVEGSEEVYMAAFEPVAKAEAVLMYVANFGDSLTADRVGALMYSPVYQEVRKYWNEDQANDFETAFRNQVNERLALMKAMERYRLSLIGEQLERATNAMAASAQLVDGMSAEDMKAFMKKVSSMDDTALVDAVLTVSREKA